MTRPSPMAAIATGDDEKCRVSKRFSLRDRPASADACSPTVNGEIWFSA